MKNHYVVKDTVELGYQGPIVGGSVSIALHFPDQRDFDQIVSIIDSFDHCSITRNPGTAKFCRRYFILLELSGDLFLDIAKILALIFDDKRINRSNITAEIQLEKESVAFDLTTIDVAQVVASGENYKFKESNLC